MERIFKIKTKTDRVPISTYPSERRYSASMVIGLSVVFLQLFFYSILMGTLILHKMTVHPYINNIPDQNNTEEVTVNSTEIVNLSELNPNNSNKMQVQLLKLYEKVDRDIDIILEQNKHLHVVLNENSEMYINVAVLMCSGCFLMSFGYILAFGLGVLAWKQWYIDHNITLFFLASAFSSLTAAIALLISVFTCINLDYDYDTYTYEVNRVTPITFSLAMNITILSTIGLIWSFLASKVAYVGMKSGYPDDMIFNKVGRHVEVSTEQKGNKKCVFPQDIIDRFPSNVKLAKYLPTKENGNLPKSESTLEFQQRVNRFLSEVPENSVKNC